MATIKIEDIFQRGLLATVVYILAFSSFMLIWVGGAMKLSQDMPWAFYASAGFALIMIVTLFIGKQHHITDQPKTLSITKERITKYLEERPPGIRAQEKPIIKRLLNYLEQEE